MPKKQPLYPHVPKSRKKPGTEELKSWGELTLQEKLAYARRVVGSGIPGWDNMKAIAYEMGIEPDEDEIPTLFELGKMVGREPPGGRQSSEEHRELASKPKKPPLYPHVTKGHNGSGSKENPLGARRFPLGQLVMTRGVADKVAEDTEFAKFVMVSIARHATGDWGDMVKEDKAENELALREGNLRLFSAYEHPRLPKIWIITEADRSVTTVLFPEEY